MVAHTCLGCVVLVGETVSLQVVLLVADVEQELVFSDQRVVVVVAVVVVGVAVVHSSSFEQGSCAVESPRDITVAAIE